MGNDSVSTFFSVRYKPFSIYSHQKKATSFAMAERFFLDKIIVNSQV